MRRAARYIAAGALLAGAYTGLAACQVAMAPARGCVIPGTHVTVPSQSGARFGGQAHSCVNGAWQAFSARDNLR